VAATLAVWVCAFGPAFAHHSNSMYDRTTSVTLKGSVKAFQWTNPHAVIWVMVQPQDGGEPQEWAVETTSPGVLTRNGWTHDSIKAGDRVSVEFQPRRIARRIPKDDNLARYRSDIVRQHPRPRTEIGLSCSAQSRSRSR